MTLLDRLATDLVAAMKAKDAARLSVLRMVKSALGNAMIEAKGAGKPFDDAGAVACVQSYAKKLRESVAEYREGGREDLVTATEAELRIVEEYLPQQMGEDEVRAVVVRIHAATGAREVGPLTGAVMKELKGKADGTTVRRIVEEALQNG